MRFEDFSYMYMFLEFKDEKKETRKAIKVQKRVERSNTLQKSARSSQHSSKNDESEDSFESDSDFEDLLDDEMQLKMGNSMINEKDMNPNGTFKKRNWFNRRYKRFKRKFNKTKCGRFLSDLRGNIRRTGFGQLILGWYEGLFTGSITMLISIINLMSIPYMHYYEALSDEDGIKRILI